MQVINSFSGENRFLSNFYLCSVEYKGLFYPSSEHAFQAAKTPHEVLKKIIQSKATPERARRRGRKLTLKYDWDEVKINIMREIVMHKFIQNVDLRKDLLSTGDAYLVEGNTWGDAFWGKVNGSGLNWLGIILMDTRKVLRATKRIYKRR